MSSRMAPASPYASYFGINWGSSSDTLQDKIFLPILGDPYGQVLDKGELTIAYDESGFSLNYYAHRLPVALISYLNSEARQRTTTRNS